MPAVGERRSEEARTEPEGRNPGFRPTAPDCAASRLRLLKARCPHRAPERSIGQMLASANIAAWEHLWLAQGRAQGA